MAAAAGVNAGFTYGWAAADTWDMNTNWTMLDANFMLAVISMSLTAPPASPTAADRYSIPKVGVTPPGGSAAAVAATGAWAGKNDTIARWNGTAWEFTTQKEGWICRNRVDSRIYHYDGGGNWLSTTPYVSTQGTIAQYSGVSYGLRQLDFQLGFATADAGSGYIQVSMTGKFSVPLSTTQLGTTLWPFDFSGATQTLAVGSYTSIAAGAGLLIVTNNTNGDIGVFAVGGGNVVLIASTAATWVASASPAAGKVGVYYSSTSGLYTIFNNSGAAFLATIGGIKARASV